MMKKTAKRCLLLALVMAITGVMTCADSFAYFQRGSVNVYAGRGSVSVTQGSSASVSISFSPSSSRQLPGCGMAECPQICGEKDCLDANGECKCAGTVYQTYYPTASVSSSNTSVATASYSGGVLYINGISPGSATITVRASLRQFSSTSTSINVTVSGRSETATSGTSSSGGGSQGKVSAKSVDKKDKKNKNDESTKARENGETVKSDRGTINFVQISDGKMGKEYLEKIMGKKEYVDFQKKDESDTVLYTWEFLGTDLNEARDMDLNLDFSRKAFEGCKYGSEEDSVYLKRGDEDALPGKASTFIRVSDWFKDSDKLYLYSFASDDGVKMMESGLSVENGYVTSDAMYGEQSRYILSKEKWNVGKEEVKESKNSYAWIIGAVVAVVAAVIAAVIIVERKRKKDID